MTREIRSTQPAGTSPSRTSGSAGHRARTGLDAHGLAPTRDVHWNLSPALVYEQTLARGEGRLAHMGALAAVTAPHTGRSPNDRLVVREPATEDRIDWGKVNAPIDEASYQALRKDLTAHLNESELFVRDARAGAASAYGINVRLVSTHAWYTLFAYNMFLRLSAEELATADPDFTILHAPEFTADPARHGTRSGTFIVVNFADRVILIGGTRYAGEIKKSIFSVMNFLLPEQGVLSMHCSANVGEAGDTALFFGLSGTGKTTLSSGSRARAHRGRRARVGRRRRLQLRGRVLREGDPTLARG
jgi:phosphoenolpyruvate carboxykinase (ATP)